MYYDYNIPDSTITSCCGVLEKNTRLAETCASAWQKNTDIRLIHKYIVDDDAMIYAETTPTPQPLLRRSMGYKFTRLYNPPIHADEETTARIKAEVERFKAEHPTLVK